MKERMKRTFILLLLLLLTAHGAQQVYAIDGSESACVHRYVHGVCTDCGYQIEESGLHHAIPESEGVVNAIERAYQFTDVVWSPVENMPGVNLVNGEWIYQEFIAGETYRGVPYSGVIDTDTYVGLNVSPDSFLTALENPQSVLYTRNLFAESYPKKATYYGTVCSKFAQYVLDIPGSYNTANITRIPGVNMVAEKGKYTANQIKLGDVLVDPTWHTAVCTDLLYDAAGNVAYIEISEAMPPTVRRLWWSVEEFFAEFAAYHLCRYAYVDSVPTPPECIAGSDYALMPEMGDKVNYRVSETAGGTVHILQPGYTKAVVLRDGTMIQEIPVGDATSFEFDRSQPGNLEMYLEKADGTRSGSVFACVVDSSVTVTDASDYAYGKLTVSYSGTSGTPLYVQIGSAHAVFCELDSSSNTATVEFALSAVASQHVRVAYQNEYGIYLSPWTSFTANANPSDDPLLSQGQYWDGRTLTPSSSSPVEVSGKEGYWTYTMVPVQGNAKYYSMGANRTWFFDGDGEPICTINVYTECTPAYQFTTPENAAYVSLSYSPDLVEKGTETLIALDNNRQCFRGKVISILGDSISTFAGYIPTADGFNREHLARYPQDDLLTDVKETWWMQVINELDAKLGINDSWRGATFSGAVPVTSGDTGENAALSNLIRIQNLGSNGTPDLILLYGGTNDLAHVEQIGTFDPAKAPSDADLTTTKWDNLADGFLHTVLRIRYFYPDTRLVVLLPTYTASYYSDEKLAQGNAVMAAICAHYGIPYLDLRDSGVTAEHLPDGIHPGPKGMDLITNAVVGTLVRECSLEPGENVVYSVTHALNGAESALSYYQGVSHGEPFETTIIGEDLSVGVTMGGVDITESVYADGVISIPAVTGDIVITAQGRIKPVYEDHLRQLPESVCPGTNLWLCLEHDPEYYTENGWAVHSSGQVCSVTIPVDADDRLWATSFREAVENGGPLDGIRVTWFDETGVLKSMSAEETSTEFRTYGYLTVPEGAVAVNIPMWSDGDENELYILSRAHCNDLEITFPSCTEQGYTTHTCTLCGYVETADYVEALGHDWNGDTCIRCGETLENPFGDVKESDYFFKPVLWAVENGITSGTSATTFAPSNPCTRGQVVTFLYRAFSSE